MPLIMTILKKQNLINDGSWFEIATTINQFFNFVKDKYPNCYIQLDTFMDNFAVNKGDLIFLDVLSVRCKNE